MTTYIATLGFIYTGEHVAQKIREQYLAAILRQNIGFFDKLGAGEITTRITADTNLVQDGLSEKVGLTMNALATFITAFIIGFIKSWKLTLILASTVFAIVFVMGGGSTFIVKYNKQSLASYALGGTVAEEVISSIRNAVAFGTQQKLAKQYEEHLLEAQKWGLKMKIALGTMVAGMMCVVSMVLSRLSQLELTILGLPKLWIRILARIKDVGGHGIGSSSCSHCNDGDYDRCLLSRKCRP